MWLPIGSVSRRVEGAAGALVLIYGKMILQSDMTSSAGHYKTQISLCIINYNGLGFLPDTLGAAQDYASQFAEILFVDNGSTDGSIDFVARSFPTVRIVPLDSNLGAGGARNAGIEAATTRFLLFLDNDVILLPDCVPRLMSAMSERPRAILAAPCVRYRHRPDTVQFCGADNHYLGLMILHDEDRLITDIAPDVRATSSVVTASFLVDRSKLTSENRFDEVYFYQMEDHDFGVRQRFSGFEILAVPEAQVLHGEGAQGLSIRRGGAYSEARIYGLIRNRWLFILKFYRWHTILILVPIFIFYEAAQFAVVLKKGWFINWCRSVGWIITNWRSIMTKRIELDKFRRISDRDYLSGGPIPHRQELTTNRIEILARSMLDHAASRYWRLVQRLI